MEHEVLIAEGTVVPGNPGASELYNRLLTTDTAKRMPLGQPNYPPKKIDTIRNWKLAGAPDWASYPQPIPTSSPLLKYSIPLRHT